MTFLTLPTEETSKITITEFKILSAEGFDSLTNARYISWISFNNAITEIQEHVAIHDSSEVKFQLTYADDTIYTGCILILNYDADDEYSWDANYEGSWDVDYDYTSTSLLHKHIYTHLEKEIRCGTDNGKAQYHLDNYDIGC